MSGFETRRAATLWHCSAEFELDGAQSALMWEPLSVQPPLTAIPYCCYLRTVIFYRDKLGHDEIARCETRDLNTPSPTLVFLGGLWWQVAGGKVVQRNGRWAMQWRLYKNDQLARELNVGREAEKRRQLGEQS